MKDAQMSTHLAGGRLNVALLQETMRKEFLNLLQLCDGPKVTIWDEWLAGPVGLVAQYSLLTDHQVVEMFPLRPGSLPTISVKHIVFIARPKLALMDIIADYIMSLRNKQAGVEFHLFFVPRRSLLCEKHLSNLGVISNLCIQEFRCDIFPFESDVMSLELQNDFRENYLEGDPTCIYNAAQALRVIQQMYGIIPRVFGKGVAAKQVWDLLCRLNKEEQGTGPRGSTTSCIDNLLLIDRAIDFTSVMTTQLTYEGLIDELYGIKSATVCFPGHKFVSPDDANPEVSATEKKRIILNSGEKLFAELRDCNFTAVGAALSKQANLIKTQLDERYNKSMQEMKQFVARLPQILANKQSLATHTAIAEYIKETTDDFDFHDIIQCEEDFLNCIDNEKVCTFIEDLIAKKEPITKVLRLICLQCATGSGLKPRVLEHYRRELVHVYGLRAWLSLCNLDKCGLLKPQQGNRQYTVLRKALRLTMDESELDEKDKGYLSSKFTPLTVRLSEHIAKNKGWSGIQDVLTALPGPTVDELQTLQPRMVRRNSISSESSSLENPRVILVFFIGGCTHQEISALRNISQQEDSSVEFVILTTKLINGTTFIESLMESE